MSEDIQVTVKITETVPAPIAAEICEQFLEWLDREGWSIAPATTTDERAYDDLAKEFIEEWPA